MKLVPAAAAGMPVHRAAARAGHDHGDGLEWEDLMPDINRWTDPSNMIWQLIDRETGAVNGAIDWAFTVGDRVKIRLVNEMDPDHPMHHPFHIHGAGRFLIFPRRRAGDQSGLEGHGAGAGRADGGHPARRHEPGVVDGALPHRRAHRERHDVQFQRSAGRSELGSRRAERGALELRRSFGEDRQAQRLVRSSAAHT